MGRFIAFHRGAGDREAVNATISTAMALCCASASIVLVVSVGLQFIFFHFFDVPPAMAAETRLALWLICLNLALTFPLSLFDGVLWASGRFDLLNAIDIPAMFARALLSYFVVTRGHGLVGLAIVTISLTVVVGLVKAAVGFRIDPGIRIRLSAGEHGDGQVAVRLRGDEPGHHDRPPHAPPDDHDDDRVDDGAWPG